MSWNYLSETTYVPKSENMRRAEQYEQAVRNIIKRKLAYPESRSGIYGKTSHQFLKDHYEHIFPTSYVSILSTSYNLKLTVIDLP